MRKRIRNTLVLILHSPPFSLGGGGWSSKIRRLVSRVLLISKRDAPLVLAR